MNSYEKMLNVHVQLSNEARCLLFGRILRLPPSNEHVCRIAFCKISRVRLLMSVLYSYFMPVCSIVELLSRGAVDDLMHYCRSSGVPRGNRLTILQTGMK